MPEITLDLAPYVTGDLTGAEWTVTGLPEAAVASRGALVGGPQLVADGKFGTDDTVTLETSPDGGWYVLGLPVYGVGWAFDVRSTDSDGAHVSTLITRYAAATGTASTPTPSGNAVELIADHNANAQAHPALRSRISALEAAPPGSGYTDAQARAQADAAVGTHNVATDAHEDIRSAITTEQAARIQADTDEITARDAAIGTAITAERTQRTNADNAEAQSRMASDTALSARITTLEDVGANNVIPYKIGNIYRRVASGTLPDKPANNAGTATSAGITVAPAGWQLTRPEATEALPWVFDCHTYGYDINGVFGWQFGTPNRTDRFVQATGGGTPRAAGTGLTLTGNTLSVDFGEPTTQPVRVVWSEGGNFPASLFAGMSAAVGTTGEQLIVPTPPDAFSTGSLGVWVGGSADRVAGFFINGINERNSSGFWPGSPHALTVDGVAGVFWDTAILPESDVDTFDGQRIVVTLDAESVPHFIDQEIDTRTAHRLLPTGAAARQIARRNADNTEWIAETLPDTGTVQHTLVNGAVILSGNNVRTTATATFPTGFANLLAYDLIEFNLQAVLGATTGARSGLVKPNARAFHPRRIEIPLTAATGNANPSLKNLTLRITQAGQFSVGSENFDANSVVTLDVTAYKFSQPPEGATGAGGLSLSQVEALIAQHTALQNAHHPYAPRTFDSTLIWQAVTAGAGVPAGPAAAQYNGTGYSNLGAWSTLPPGAVSGMDVYAMVLQSTFITASWVVAIQSSATLIYEGGVQAPFAVRYLDEAGNASDTVDVQHHYQQIFDAASGVYSQLIPIPGRASTSLHLILRQDLPVSGTATAGPTINTTRTLFSDFPLFYVNVQLRIGATILREQGFMMSTAELVPVSIANQNEARSQKMLIIAVNSPFGTAERWAMSAIIDGNTTRQRHPNGYERRYLFNFVRSDSDPAGSTARAFSHVVCAEHDAGTFATGVRFELYGVV